MYDGFGNYLYGFWLNNFLVAFILLKLFSQVSNIKIPWWFYLLMTFTFSSTLDQSFGGQLIRLILFTVLIYLLVVRRHLSYNRIAAFYLVTTSFFFYIQAFVGPIVLGVLTMAFPAQSTMIKNYGANVVLLIDFGLATWLLTRLKPVINDYLRQVGDARPLLSWLINLFIISFYFIRSAFHFQFLRINLPTYLVSAIVYFLATYLLIKYVTNYVKYQQLSVYLSDELTSLAEYTSHIESMYDDLRRFRHDYKNLLLSLDDAIQAKDIGEVTAIYNRVIKPSQVEAAPDQPVLGHLSNIQSVEVKSLIYSKVMTAINHGIKVEIEVEKPITPNKKVAIPDFLRMIAILFDNATVAAQQASQSKINLSYFTDDQNNQMLIIGNTTRQERIDLGSNHRLLAMQPNKHGLGLRNLQMLIARYPFITNNRRSNHHWFEQELIIHQA